MHKPKELRLDASETAIFEVLKAEIDAETPGDEKLAFWSSDEVAREEAAALFLELLGEIEAI